MDACLPACSAVFSPLCSQISVRARVCPAPLHLPLCSTDMSHLVTMNFRVLHCWLALLEKPCTPVKMLCMQDRTWSYISPQALCSSNSWVDPTDFTPKVPYNVPCVPWPVLLVTWPSFEQVLQLREHRSTGHAYQGCAGIASSHSANSGEESTFTKPLMYLCLDFKKDIFSYRQTGRNYFRILMFDCV